MSTPPPPGPRPQEPQGPFPQGQYAQGPHAAPGPYPYQPWGQGYRPYNSPAPVNGVAIAALVLGILCFVPALGLLLGLVALRQIRRTGERGRGMAVTGAVLSGLGLVLWVAVPVGGAAFDARVKDAARDHGSAYSLTKGECFDAPGGSLEGMAYDVDKVPCSGLHDAEVFATFRMTGGADYPGDGRLTDVADTRCYALRYGYAMDAWSVPDDVDVYYLTPSRQSWRYGDREVTCLFGNTDEKAGLKGSLRNDKQTLDADQVVYLKAVDIENAALEGQPPDSPDDDLRSSRQWAGRMSAALTEEARMLRDHPWPAGARTPVAKVAKEVAARQEEWARAAKAGDANSFYEHYDLVMALSTPDRAVTARKALGLAATPPESRDEEDGEDGTGGGSEFEV
ncbi:DUF4190 domain-containing protein [Streptomyces sp. TLI_185]|uniref:DUF4190 domain-containing protein n=1 Tax=Streptomyces sp. TLI_185 TaxID=2485151 RepID=UPI000F5043D9|nr:DUF4190 domain-containing protein [Streptomyces sp. TLI_185]RPF35994.1 putative regulator of septum formation [Streptomyces sp. TLI_185]